MAVLLPFAFLLLVGLTSSVAQTGWMIVFSKIAPDLGKLSPLKGFGRSFSLNAVVELAKSVAKLIVVGAICYMVLKPRVQDLELLPSMEVTAILAYLHHVLIRLMMAIAMVMVVIAASDWFYQRYSFLKKAAHEQTGSERRA